MSIRSTLDRSFFQTIVRRTFNGLPPQEEILRLDDGRLAVFPSLSPANAAAELFDRRPYTLAPGEVCRPAVFVKPVKLPVSV